jgi:ABC-type Fe3+/spermidine/putrescine transport system ATPase subunit
MTVSDRIVVMDRGRIMQVGTPTEVYRKPANEFVAGFIGQVNFLRGQLEPVGEGWRFVADADLDIPIPDAALHPGARATGQPVELAIRPEAIELQSREGHPPAPLNLCGVVTRAVYTGASTTYHVQLSGGQTLQVLDQDRPGSRRWGEGEAVSVTLVPESLYVVPAAT